MNKKPLTILFDANPMVNGNKSGVGYYTHSLIQALADNYPDHIKLVGHYFSFLGKKDHLALPRAKNIQYVRSRLIPGKVLSITRRLGFQPPLEIFFKRTGDTAIFTNYFSLPSIFKIPRMVVLHDLCYIEAPQFVSKKNREFIKRFVPHAVKTASRIITISDATKRAIKKYYSVPDDKFVITPIPPIVKHPDRGYDLAGIGVKGTYILFVGTLEPRKNILGLVQAYEQLLPALRDEYQLVLAGGVGWYMEETQEYIAGLKKQGLQIITPGYISDDAKAALYEHANLFVLPSHYEGFGMPILEAMDYGIPTAVSDIEVFHEVAGSASLYFDKDSPASIAKAMAKVLGSPDLQKELVAKGHERLKSYNWQDIAQSVYENIKQICGRP